ncbi:DUF4199 domain-containing protein [Pontibacter vulgaris]|uniref:DUF4199 domain-containing protein n=1 Tax=Pontibacter vulgaris TaxID=2905679 RepID=UPI001FA7EDED|nr:DUF4199 domain-containing protein [Pontibacter vulgaris]
MFNQTIIRVGIRYGVMCGLACFGILLLQYFLGFNPLGEVGRWSFLPMPVFLFLGIRYYKLFNDTEIGFLKGLRVGLSISFYTALTAGMLLFILLYFAGGSLIQQYVSEMKTTLEVNKAEQIKALGQDMYNQSIEALDNITPSLLATYDFVSRLLVGGLFSIVAAVFFRK